MTPSFEHCVKINFSDCQGIFKKPYNKYSSGKSKKKSYKMCVTKNYSFKLHIKNLIKFQSMSISVIVFEVVLLML